MVGEYVEYIAIGKIINTHGIKGDLKIYPYTDNIKRFSDLSDLYIGQEKLQVSVGNIKYHKDFVLMKLKEYDNINDVLIFKEKLIYIDESEKVELEMDNYFIHDLIGCKVYDKEGKLIGVIDDVLQNSSNDVYIIKDNEKEYMIPAVKEFIKSVDVSEKSIIVEPIEGMIE